MVRAAALVAITGVGGTASAETQGHMRLAMQFTCITGQPTGHPIVRPASEQTFDIIDRRESQRITVCPRSGAGSCREMTVHRFTLQCGASPQPWISVAAVALAQRPGLTVEIDSGRLVLTRTRARAAVAARCFGRLDGAGARMRLYDSGMLDECWRTPDRPDLMAARETIVLPPGFAPAGMLGARFLPPAKPTPAQPPPSTTADAWAVKEAVPSNPLAFAPPLATAAKTASAPGQRAIPTPPDPIAQLVTPADVQPAPGEVSRTGLWLVLAGGLLATLIGAATFAAARRSSRDPVRLPRFTGTDVEIADQLATLARDRRDVCRAALDAMPAALELRQVIARELQVSADRLAAIEGDSPATPEAARRLTSRLRVVARDLQRLATIAEGARASLGEPSASPTHLPEPRDRVEAFAVLGVSPDADTRVTKKLVEALRQSWHPDQARDDADRRHREHRIKQINVAWDLIKGKRAEA